MSTPDARLTALIATLEQQRNAAMNAVASLQAELAVRDETIKQLSVRVEELSKHGEGN